MGTLNYETNDLTATFTMNTSPLTHMKAWIKGNKNRKIFKVDAPPTIAAPYPYGSFSSTIKTPTFIIRQDGSAYLRPFIVIYESYKNNNSVIQSVRNVSNISLSGDLVGLVISSKNIYSELNDQKEYIFNATDTSKEYTNENIIFKGIYAVISKNISGYRYLYLGNGIKIKTELYSIVSFNSNNIYANLNISNISVTQKDFSYSAEDQIILKIRYYNNISLYNYTNLKMYYKVNNYITEASTISAIQDSGVISNGWGYITSRLPANYDSEIFISKGNIDFNNESGQINIFVNNYKINKIGYIDNDTIVNIKIFDSKGLDPNYLIIKKNGIEINKNNYLKNNKSYTNSEITLYLKNDELIGDYTVSIKNIVNEKKEKFFTLLKNNDKKNIKIFPNPVIFDKENKINIETTLNQNDKKQSVYITDVTGQIIYNFTDISTANIFTWSGINKNTQNTVYPGIYFIIIKYISESKLKILSSPIIVNYK